MHEWEQLRFLFSIWMKKILNTWKGDDEKLGKTSEPLGTRKGETVEDAWYVQLAALEARCKSNTHRIDELAADNQALHTLTASVSVLASKQESIESDVSEIKSDVKELKALPASRWETLWKAAVTAVVAGVIGFALACLGLGG